MKLSSAEMALLINDCVDAIERSKIGPIYPVDNNPQRGINQLACGVLVTLIQAQIPHVVHHKNDGN